MNAKEAVATCCLLLLCGRASADEPGLLPLVCEEDRVPLARRLEEAGLEVDAEDPTLLEVLARAEAQVGACGTELRWTEGGRPELRLRVMIDGRRLRAAFLPRLRGADGDVEAELALTPEETEDEGDGKPERDSLGPDPRKGIAAAASRISPLLALPSRAIADGADALAEAWRSSALREQKALLTARAYLHGSFPKKGGSRWQTSELDNFDNTPLELATTGKVLLALSGSIDPRAAKQGEAAQAFLRFNADYTRSSDGNNNEPYAWAYGIMALVDRINADPRGVDAKWQRELVEKLLEGSATGTWRYMADDAGKGAATFQLVLLAEALQKAKAAGFKIPERRGPVSGKASTDSLERVIELLVKSRDKKTGGFPYTLHRSAPEGDCAFRSPYIEHVLFKAGRSDRASLEKAAERFLAHRAEFEKQIFGSPNERHHGSHHNWAFYYYPFGMEGMSYVLEDLRALGHPKAKQWARELTEAMMSQQAPDGSWAYSRHSLKNADTATFVIALERLRKTAR